MAQAFRPGYADPKGAIVYGFDQKIILAQGTTVPADGTAGYSPGAIFMDRDAAAGLQFWINAGSATSSLFQPVQGAGIGGVGSGYKIARGEHVQVAASDTVVTGLTTVVSVTATPRLVSVKQMWFGASIGDQAGTPAAGSILITSYKPTNNTNDSTPTAATDFSENIKVNWIAVGT